MYVLCKRIKVSSCSSRIKLFSAAKMSKGSFARQVKQKRSAGGVDRISDLPEALIIHILSLLPTTEDRITTEVLFRRWKNLWTCVPNLDLEFDYCFEPYLDDYEDEVYSNVDKFVHRVDKTLKRILSSSGGTKVKKFRVQMPYLDIFSINVNHWVWFSETNETEEFELDFEPHGDNGFSCPLPWNIYKNSYFRELRFNYCYFCDCKTLSWDALKKLTIETSQPGGFHEKALEKIGAGTPVLEFLDLQLHQGISKLDFRNSVLKKLVLHIKDWDSGEKKEAAFEIRAPSVESLKVSGCFRTCKLVDMASLVEATLFGMPVERDAGYPILTEEVVSSLLNVKTLTVSTWVIQGIATMLINDGRPLFPECKCLRVDTHLWEEDPSAIARLLKNTPKVETLIVTMSEPDTEYKNFKKYTDSNIDQFWTSEETASSYLRSLGTAKFIGFRKYRAPVFPFVQFLLKNAKGLQQVAINLEEKDSWHKIAPTELLEISQKLLSYPISSPDAKLLINP